MSPRAITKKASGRPPGRPKTKEYATLLARVPQELVDRIKTYSRLHRQSISELIRDGLEWRITDGDPLAYRMVSGYEKNGSQPHAEPSQDEVDAPTRVVDEQPASADEQPQPKTTRRKKKAVPKRHAQKGEMHA